MHAGDEMMDYLHILETHPGAIFDMATLNMPKKPDIIWLFL